MGEEIDPDAANPCRSIPCPPMEEFPFGQDWIARTIRQTPTEYEKRTGQLDLGVDQRPQDFARNQFTFYAEGPYHLLSPEQQAKVRAENASWHREQRRLKVRTRKCYRAVKQRLRDTWGVLLHGLPEHDSW